MVADERRQYKRIDRRVQVSLTQYDEMLGKDIIHQSESLNISAGGLLITANAPFEISSFVHAKFDIGNGGKQKDILAKVVRVDEIEPFVRYDIGLQFVENLPHDDPSLAE